MIYFKNRNRSDKSELSIELDAQHLDAVFFETLRVERQKLIAADRVAIVLRALFGPSDLISLSPSEYANLKLPPSLTKKHLAPIAKYRGEAILLPDSVTKICRWLFSEQNGRPLGSSEPIGYNAEVFDGSIGAHADSSQKEPYGPTIHTTYSGQRQARIAIDGSLGGVPDFEFVDWWREVQKINLTLNAGDMLLFFGFHDLSASREGNPHEFSSGGRSICLDRLIPADIDLHERELAIREAKAHDHDLFSGSVPVAYNNPL